MFPWSLPNLVKNNNKIWFEVLRKQTDNRLKLRSKFSNYVTRESFQNGKKKKKRKKISWSMIYEIKKTNRQCNEHWGSKTLCLSVNFFFLVRKKNTFSNPSEQWCFKTAKPVRKLDKEKGSSSEQWDGIRKRSKRRRRIGSDLLGR